METQVQSTFLLPNEFPDMIFPTENIRLKVITTSVALKMNGRAPYVEEM